MLIRAVLSHYVIKLPIYLLELVVIFSLANKFQGCHSRLSGDHCFKCRLLLEPNVSGAEQVVASCQHCRFDMKCFINKLLLVSIFSWPITWTAVYMVQLFCPNSTLIFSFLVSFMKKHWLPKNLSMFLLMTYTWFSNGNSFFSCNLLL